MKGGRRAIRNKEAVRQLEIELDKRLCQRSSSSENTLHFHVVQTFNGIPPSFFQQATSEQYILATGFSSCRRIVCILNFSQEHCKSANRQR